jgi:hypothetical protein
MTRSEYWNAYARRLAKLERKYAPKVYRALLAQVKRFTSSLREGNRKIEIINPEVALVLRQMHIEGAVSEGKNTLRMLRSGQGLKRLGTNEEWTNEIISRLQVHNARFIASITETTREYLLRMLEDGLREGLNLNEIAAKIDKEVEQIYRNRSFAIARTELNRAANLGNMMAANKYEYEVEKVWITAKDHRVRGLEGDRFSHIRLDGQRIDANVPFNNGENIMQPGDASASPGNTINCRCTIALIGKRDRNNRLISKPSRLFQTI